MSDVLQELTYRVAMMQRELERLETLEVPLTKIGARVYANGVQTAPNSSFVALSFTSARYDTDGLWNSSAATRLTCTRAGIYLITAHVVFAVNATGVRYVNIRVNNTLDIASHGGSASSAFETAYSVSTIYQLAAGEYVEARVFQSSGGFLNINASAATSPELAMHRLA